MKVIVVGCGRVGSGVANVLALRRDAVSVVDRDPLAFERLAATFDGTTVAGVGFDRDVLLKAGIRRADGLAAVTGSDEANVVTARLARLVFRVPRVVARLYDPRKAEIYRRLGLQTIAPVPWGISRIAEALSFGEHNTVLSLGSGQVEIVEAEIPAGIAGRRVGEIAVPGEVQIVAITRHGQAFLPMPGTAFETGDIVSFGILAAAAGRLQRLLAG